MIVPVNFNETVKDWLAFAEGLNASLAEDDVVAFDFGEPLMHEDFCPFIFRLKRKWRMRTTLWGPGFLCLKVDRVLACEEIVAVFEPGPHYSLYTWFRRPIMLREAGYNIRVEVPCPVNTDFLKRFGWGRVTLQIDVVPPRERVLKAGFTRRHRRACDGELAVIWSDGRFYPCPWAPIGGLKGPVYSYGSLDEPFKAMGKDGCYLRDCPLEVSDVEEVTTRFAREEG